MAACALMMGSVVANADQTPVAGGIYYLYNTACTDGNPGFMSTGNGYGFQVVIDNFGFPVKLIDVGSGNFQFQFIHHNGYLSDDGFMYSDGGTDRARTITIQDQGDGTYKLLNTNNSKEIEDWYGNVVGDGTGDRHNYKWRFLSKDERNAMLAGYTESQKLAAAASMGITLSEQTSAAFDNYISTNYIGIDQSSKIQNGTFDTSHNTEGWTTAANSNRSFNIGWGNVNPKTTPEVYEGAGEIKQTVTVDKAGLYKVSVNATYRCGNSENNNRIGDLGYDGSVAYLKANNNYTKIGDWYSGKINGNGPGNPSEANSTYFSAGKYYTEVYVYVDDTKTIDISLHSHAFTWGGWLMFNNFKLTYYSDAVSDEDAQDILGKVAALDGKPMEGSVELALGTAKTTFEASKTIANYNALNEAYNLAKASIDAYASAKAYFDEAETILAGTNVYTAAAYATYYTEPKAKYEARTLTDAEAKALVKTSTGHKSANTINRVLLSSWTIGGAQCQDFDTNLYINTWSVEGNNDGSNFLTPFFEYWTNDDKSLGANTLVASVTGLKANTTYSFTIRARVRQTNSQTKIAEGITMKVGDGTAVDISAGAQFNGGQFYIGNFSAMGETDAEGKLTATITVAENSNISWLSFYNCKYTEGEDLSAYIADYQFALSTATLNSTNATYANVTGKEKADLTAALTTYATVDETDKAALIAAKEALEAVNATFVNAAATYNTFAELNKNVAAKLGVTLPTITETTVAADLKVEDYIVAEYTAAKAYTQDFTNKLGDWTNAPGTNKKESWDGTDTDTYYDEYNKADRAMTQSVVLPAGDYALIAKGRASTNGLLTLVVGDETVTFAHKSSVGRGIATDGTATFADDATYANSNNGRGWEYRVMTFTSDGETATTLTFNWKTASNNWCGLDDIVLLCNPAALNYDALQMAYDAVTVPTLGFEAGEYAPYVNVANFQNIEAAKAMLDNKDADSQTAINDMTATLKGMTWTANTAEVNAICGGDFTQYETIGGQDMPYGWNLYNNGTNNSRIMGGTEGTTNAGLSAATSGKALLMKFNATYGETTGYTMPLKANRMYKITFKYGGWNNAPATVVMLKDPAGNEIKLAPDFRPATTDAHSNAEHWYTYTGYFASTTTGDYTLNFNKVESGQQQIVIADIELVTAGALEFADGAVPTYAPGTYPAVKVSRTLTAGKWATAIYPFALSLPASVSSFVKVASLDDFDETDGGVYFTSITANTANQPFLMRTDNDMAVAAVAAGLTLNNVEVDEAKAISVDEDNLSLKGVYDSTDLTSDDDAKYYVLKDNKIYLVSTDASKKATINPYRAYLQLNQTSPARELTFIVDGEITTAIEGLNVEQNENGNVYNLNGQRVEKAQKGLYIKNGKKVVVK